MFYISVLEEYLLVSIGCKLKIVLRCYGPKWRHNPCLKAWPNKGKRIRWTNKLFSAFLSNLTITLLAHKRDLVNGTLHVRHQMDYAFNFRHNWMSLTIKLCKTLLLLCTLSSDIIEPAGAYKLFSVSSNVRYLFTEYLVQQIHC